LKGSVLSLADEPSQRSSEPRRHFTSSRAKCRMLSERRFSVHCHTVPRRCRGFLHSILIHSY